MWDKRLKNGSKVAVIGGGPSGSFFAHFLLKLAHKKGLKISVSIFEGKNFLLKGSKGCNLCAGIISGSLESKLASENIPIPEKRVINRLNGYTLHTESEDVFISCKEGKTCKIATVFRGNGPILSSHQGNLSFDDFLLSTIQAEGAKIYPFHVWDIQLSAEKGGLVKLLYGDKKNPQEFRAHLVAAAFGVNSFLIRKMQHMRFTYRAPKIQRTFQAEFHLGKQKIFKEFGNSIHVYMPRSKIIRYATLIPKGNFASVTIVGRQDADQNILKEFYKFPKIKKIIPENTPHCVCLPGLVVSSAETSFADRMVIVGDAYTSRLYKNGLESAFITARTAAETAVFSGISKESFAGLYAKKINEKIIHDNRFGKWLFKAGDAVALIPLLTRLQMFLVRDNKRHFSQRLRAVLWNIFTGSLPYKRIFRMLFP